MTLAVSWDQWRASYAEWTVEDQRRFYDEVFAECREQQRFSSVMLSRFLNHIDSGVAIVELGGWDGEFAAVVLPNHPEITSWTNFEISAAAVEGSVCDDPRFAAVVLDDWYWATEHHADVFVASHVLEHLAWRDVQRVFDATHADWVYLQAPLHEGQTCWDGYHGSHILEVGWSEVTAALEERGFTYLPGLSKPGIRCFERVTR